MLFREITKKISLNGKYFKIKTSESFQILEWVIKLRFKKIPVHHSDKHAGRNTDICLLNEIDHPCVSVGHFPVFGQWFQILISHHIISKVHGAICLVITWNSLHPAVRWLRMHLSGFCNCWKQKSINGKVNFF